MQSIKKTVSWLLAVSMIFSMVARIPAAYAMGPAASSQDIYKVSPDTNIYDIYDVAPDTEPVYDVTPDTEPVYNVTPDTAPGNVVLGTAPENVYAVAPDAGLFAVGTDPFIYICDAEGVTYNDAEGNPVSFGSLHEAIDASQATPIVVQYTTETKYSTQSFYVANRDGSFYEYYAGRPYLYSGLETALSVAWYQGFEMIVYEGAAEESIYICDPLKNPYRDAQGEIITYATVEDAFAAVEGYTYPTIVLNGQVPYNRSSGSDHYYSCICSDTSKIKIKRDLEIIAAPGGEATVVWDGVPTDDYRSIYIANGVSVTVGGFAADGAGTLVFDGGATWSGDYANWNETKSNGYSGRTHRHPLFYMERSEEKPGGGTLIFGETATVQNYVNTNGRGGVVAVHTAGSFLAPEDPPVTVEFYGKMINNASAMGGAIYMGGGTLNIYDGALFSGNSSDTGGAICADVLERKANSTSGASMPVAVNMYGGTVEYSSAFTGGAVALWSSTYDINAIVSDVLIPSCTFTMYDGAVLRGNTAHTWLPQSIDPEFGYGGGGAVLLTARDAVFDMQGGTIIGNSTLPLMKDGTALEQAGHAILATGSLHGDQQVRISGGTIADNGDGNGTVIDVRQEQYAYKLIMLLAFAVVGQNVLEGMNDVSALPFDTPFWNRALEMLEETGSTELTEEQVMELMITSPTDHLYDMIFDLIDYYGDAIYAGSDSEELENQMDVLNMVTQLKEDGTGDPVQALVISGDPILGEGQNLAIGQDAYITFENPTPGFVPAIKQAEHSVPGSPVVEYGSDYYLGETETVEPQYILTGNTDSLIWDEVTDTLYVIDPEKVYTVTITVSPNSEEISNLTTYTLPTKEEIVDKGWIAEEMAPYFYWYYEEHGVQISCDPGAYFVLGKNMSFVGTSNRTVQITVDLNGGVLPTDIGDLTEVPLNLSALAEIDPTLIANIYEGMRTIPVDPDPPVDPENSEVTVPRKVVAAGLTTEKVTEIVAAGYVPSGEVYHSIWSIPGVDPVFAAVNPYYVKGETTLYVLWAYDENGDDIPDFLEVPLTMNPNGGTFGGYEGESTFVAARGTEISSTYMESMMWGFSHPGVEGGIEYETQYETDPETGVTTETQEQVEVSVPVLLVGTIGVPTAQVGEVYVPSRIYSINDRAELAGLDNVLYAGQIPPSYTYTVTQAETFYAIWSYDACENTLGIPVNPDGGRDYTPDVMEVIITLDPNGGKFPVGTDESGNLVYFEEPLTLWVPKGFVIPKSDPNGDLSDLQSMIVHDPVEGSPVYLLGLSKTDTEEKVYTFLPEDKEAFAQLTDVVYTWNPDKSFTIAEDATYYAVWSTDMDEQGNPDVFEALLTIDPNGGVVVTGTDGDGEPIVTADPFMMLLPIGTKVPADTVKDFMDHLEHQSALLIGITTNPAVKGQIYGVARKAEISAMAADNRFETIFVNSISDYPVSGNVTFYAIWGEDLNESKTPDVFEPVLTFYANGGTIDPAAAGQYQITGINQAGTMFAMAVPTGQEQTQDSLKEIFGVLLIPPVGKKLAGIASDEAGNDLVGEITFTEDVTFYAVWTDKATITIHHNDGAETDVPTVWNETLYTELTAEQVAALFKTLNSAPPKGDGEKKVIAAGLTTEPVEGVVDAEYQLDQPLYHSVWAIGLDQIPAAVNPYVVERDADLYVLWAYDNSANDNGVEMPDGIPDFLEVQLKLEINAKHGLDQGSKGRLDLVDENGELIYYVNWVYIIVAKGTEVPGVFFEQIMSGLSHLGIPDGDKTDAQGNPIIIPVLPLGITTDPSVSGILPYKAIAEDKQALAALGEVLYKGDVPANYTFNVDEDTTFYAVWAEDANSNRKADIFEYVAVTIDPNGGTLKYGTDKATEPLTELKPWDSVATGIAPGTMHNGEFTHNPEKGEQVLLVGFTTDPTAEDKIYTGDDRETFVFLKDFIAVDESVTLTQDTTFYAVWGYDEDKSRTADVLEYLVIIFDPNGGMIRDLEEVDLSAVDESYREFVEAMINDGRIIEHEGKEYFVYGIRPTNGSAESPYVYMTNVIMQAVCNALLTSDSKTLVGFALDPEGNNMITNDFTIAEDTTIYAIWSSQTVSVNIEWGDLTFTYSQGAWNPNTQAYGEPTITPAGSNVITVTNRSNVAVTASFAYRANDGYENLLGSFTQGSPAAAVESPVEIAVGESAAVSLWLTGSIDGPTSGTYVCGQCVVTIEPAGS